MPFEILVDEAAGPMEEMGFSLLDKNSAERHGAWEWTWVAESEHTVHRYVIFSAVESLLPFFAVEVWAGIDTERNFGRSHFWSALLVDPVPKGVHEQVVSIIAAAGVRARSLLPDSLTESYIKPRNQTATGEERAFPREE